jgi:endo-1,4-beta-xylanase
VRTKLLQTFALGVAFGTVSCSGSDVLTPPGVGGSSATGAGGATAGGDTGASIGGISATGGSSSGNAASGGAATGGSPATGGAATGGAATGGKAATGGAGVGGTATGGAATGGNKATGGAATGGAAAGGAATGGAATGGTKATGGAAAGGAATGGTKATGGAATGGAATGGTKATGGAGTGGGTSTVNCSATMPTGGTAHAANSQGGAGSLAWQIWSNQTSGSMTTFSTPAFSATWNNSGDFLARLGLEWGNSGKTYDQFGTITAQFAYTKTGTGGGYSYIGIYGWSTNPCVEYYIVDDSYNTMPVNPGNDTNKGTLSVDGGTYNMWLRNTTGTGGNRCGSSVTSWAQYYSIRTTARQCGTISITQHFNAWKAAGMTLGSMLEAKIIVEVGGGSGTINFPVANVTAQ